MNKAFSNFTWENYPSENTAVNADNLNKINNAIDIIDSRVITQETTKLDKTTANTMVKDVTFDSATGIFTITKLNGSVLKIDTKLEKLAVNFGYDSTNQRLVITLDDGTTQYIDLRALITQYEFVDGNTIVFTINLNGAITAEIKDGSITADKLDPNYLAQINISVSKAEEAATRAESAQASAELAKESAESAAQEAVTNASNAQNSATRASQSASSASSSATNASASASTASTKATEAAASANLAQTSEAAAKSSETNAKNSETLAKESADNATQSANSAFARAEDASESANLAADEALKAQGYSEAAKSYNEQTQGILSEVNKKLELAEFTLNSNGELVYTDDSAYEFSVDENGMLNYSVV